MQKSLPTVLFIFCIVVQFGAFKELRNAPEGFFASAALLRTTRGANDTWNRTQDLETHVSLSTASFIGSYIANVTAAAEEFAAQRYEQAVLQLRNILKPYGLSLSSILSFFGFVPKGENPEYRKVLIKLDTLDSKLALGKLDKVLSDVNLNIKQLELNDIMLSLQVVNKNLNIYSRFPESKDAKSEFVAACRHERIQRQLIRLHSELTNPGDGYLYKLLISMHDLSLYYNVVFQISNAVILAASLTTVCLRTDAFVRQSTLAVNELSREGDQIALMLDEIQKKIEEGAEEIGKNNLPEVPKDTNAIKWPQVLKNENTIEGPEEMNDIDSTELRSDEFRKIN